jgi:hypothetical protein
VIRVELKGSLQAALRMALAVAAGGGMPLTGMYASPANVAFAKANYGQLKPKMDAADGITPAKK